MTEYLKMIRENSFLKLGIINLIEELSKNKELKPIENYLKDLVDGVEPNIKREMAQKQVKDIFENFKKKNTESFED